MASANKRPAAPKASPVLVKLQKIVADIRESGNATLTRLTVLKRWFETPWRIQAFGVFIARQAIRRRSGETPEVEAMFVEAHEFLAGMDPVHPTFPAKAARALHTRLVAFQNEHQRLEWGAVRVIRNWNLMLVESGIGLNLWHNIAPTEAYRLAVDYCQHYDPRYGNGLNGPSAERIEEIVSFVHATEAGEEA